MLEQLTEPVDGGDGCCHEKIAVLIHVEEDLEVFERLAQLDAEGITRPITSKVIPDPLVYGVRSPFLTSTTHPLRASSSGWCW